jgi:hypothetical protein
LSQERFTGDDHHERAGRRGVRAGGGWSRTPALGRVGEWITRALELAEPDTPSRARALVAKAFRDLDDGDASAEAAAIAERLDDAEVCVYAWDACGAVAMAAATTKPRGAGEPAV